MGILLNCTRFRVYLCQLPLIILLMIAIKQNNNVDTLLKLYPLITLLILGMIFIFVYFFRLVRIRYDEIRSIGIFSGRERSIIKKDRTLEFTLWQKNKMIVELSGKNEAPALDWIEPEDYKDLNVNLYRMKTVGSERTLRNALLYFGIPKEDHEKIFTENLITLEYDEITLVSKIEKENRKIALTFKESI